MATLLHRLAQWAEAAPDAPAQRFKTNGEWRTITSSQFMERVYHLSLFLKAKGFTGSDIGAIFSYNCPEWCHADLAMMLAGMRSTGIYPNSITKDVSYILNHTDAAFLAVQNREYFQKMLSGSSDDSILSKVKMILVFDGDTSVHPKAVSYEAALAEGKKLAQSQRDTEKLSDLLRLLDPRAGAFLIYTSGTTGNPKGAILSHDNLTYTSDCVSKFWDLPYGEGSLFSFLPLCHIAEKLQCMGVGISQRYCVSFCTKFENLMVEIVEVQPTLLLCVPRLWEKMMEGVLGKVKRSAGLKQKLAIWALGVGERCSAAKYSGKMASPFDLLALPAADKLVLSKIRQGLGLFNAKKLASGAAALPPHVSRWFRTLQLEILEDFGQTESTGVICMTEPGVESAGTVGRPVTGMDFKLGDDEEILTRGRHVFLGYHKDAASTESTLEGGWLHTGDLGIVNDRGLVEIRGRKKDILKTSGGKMVAPSPIEEKLKASDLISQVCIVGDGRKYLSALVTLGETVIAEVKSRGGIIGKIVNDPEVVSQVKAAIDRLNQGLAQYEQIKKFAVIANEFSIADGEMTPTMKMKRNVVEAHFKDVIDSLYGSGGD